MPVDRTCGGEYPTEWPYPARESMFFVAERDVHEGGSFATSCRNCRPMYALGKPTAIRTRPAAIPLNAR